MKNIFKIKVLLDVPTRDALRKVAIMLPTWHCLKGFLDVCVQEYETPVIDIDIYEICATIYLTKRNIESIQP